MQKTEKQQAAKNRQEVLKDLTEQLEKSIQEFMQGDRYKSFLTQMSKLHDYSLNNQLLIATQRPDATLCASYTTWKKNNRNVKRGEKGIRIICPSFHKVQALQDVKDPQTGKPEYLPNGKVKKEIVEKVILICTPFTGHPVKGVFLCVILTNLRKKLLNCIAKENGLMHPMI